MISSKDGSHGLIRAMSEADVENVLVWRNDPKVRHFMFSQSEISLDKHWEWFRRASRDPNIHLLIYDNGKFPLGFVSFSFSEGGVADWSLHVSPTAPKGTGTQMGVAALSYAFRELSAHKICGKVISYNIRSIGLHVKLGFFQEGILNEQYYDGSQYHSVHCFGLVCTDWRS